MIQLLLAALTVIPQPREARLITGVVPVSAPIAVERDSTIAVEGYALDVEPDGRILIRSSDAAGEFYARQTLRQLLDWRGYQCASIEDYPAYRWRGMHFDDCRHFFGKDVLKKTLEIMAQYKLNVLHWHLTEDQGWRLDIPGYHELVKFLADRGKRVLGWDEYLLGDVPKDAIGMSWRAGGGGAGHRFMTPTECVVAGHDMVMTPRTYCYLDYAQGLDEDPFQYIGGCVTLRKAHSLDLCEGIPENKRAYSRRTGQQLVRIHMESVRSRVEDVVARMCAC